VCNKYSTATITNCTFSGNTSSFGGGGLFNDNSFGSPGSPTITNCTFSGNTAVYMGSGMYNYTSSPTITNCILWGDAGGEIFNQDAASTPTITYSDVQDYTTPNLTSHNVGADPKFVRSPNLTASPVDYGNLHLQSGSPSSPDSPCIDAGSDAAVTVPPFPADSANHPLDLDGNLRIRGAHVDLGAFEFQPDTIPPTITATASKTTLWPPNGQSVPVTISGAIMDNAGGSGVDLNTVNYTVKDEYGKVQPAASVTLAQDGSYAFTVKLTASRKDTDLNGRTFTITVSAKDLAGNQGSRSVVVTVPHDLARR
jgi:hypothetical protein